MLVFFLFAQGMACNVQMCSGNRLASPAATTPIRHQFDDHHTNNVKSIKQHRDKAFTLCAAKPGGFSLNSIINRCKSCGGKGAIECPGCKGTGKNKKNGNIFERWKCFDCQGFGLKSCPVCGQGGLTPEQRGER